MKLLHSYAEESRIRVFTEFVDVETAKRSGRSGFGEMVSLFRRTPECRRLLVEKTDRLYRNLKDWVVLDELDLEIHFVKEGVVLSRDSQSSEKFLHGIKVLMAKNYVDNLSEEVRKGMREKAEQGHWPSVAPIGYRNNLETRRIEVDPERGPLVEKLFEWYASGELSLKAVTAKAHSAGLSHQRSGRKLTKSEIHRALHNPIYHGDFVWKGKRHRGLHEPLISKELFDATQGVFTASNRPRYTKHQHAFAGLLTCGRCGCVITAELKKGRCVYYHCTGSRGRCGNTYIREEDLSRLFAELVRRIQIGPATASLLAEALRQSQRDKERLHRTAVMRLQQRHLSIQTKLDRAYDDRLAGRISEGLWMRRSRAWEADLASVGQEVERHQQASHNYSATGSKILELCQRAYSLYSQQKPVEQRRLLKTLLSNCTFERGSLTPTYNKPFDLLTQGNETGNWLGGRDSNPDTMVQSHVSYR